MDSIPNGGFPPLKLCKLSKPINQISKKENMEFFFSNENISVNNILISKKKNNNDNENTDKFMDKIDKLDDLS